MLSVNHLTGFGGGESELPKTYATLHTSKWDSGYCSFSNGNLTAVTTSSALNNAAHNIGFTINPSSGIWSVEITVDEIVISGQNTGIKIGLTDQANPSLTNLTISTRQGAAINLCPGSSTNDIISFGGASWSNATGGNIVVANGNKYLVLFDPAGRRVGALNSAGTFTWSTASSGSNALTPFVTLSKSTFTSPYYQKVTLNFGASAFTTANAASIIAAQGANTGIYT